MYRINRTENTYDWIIATADSNVNNKICLIIIIGKIIILIFGPIFPNRVKSKCPAIMLAVNRIVKVNGRIRFLTDSMHTINGISRVGVFWGTKWVNISLVFFIHPYNINLNHIGRAIVRFMLKCLVNVKIYGNNLIRLLIIIKMNKLIYIIMIILLFLLLMIILNSLYNLSINL